MQDVRLPSDRSKCRHLMCADTSSLTSSILPPERKMQHVILNLSFPFWEIIIW